jgi:hypothetical protein
VKPPFAAEDVLEKLEILDEETSVLICTCDLEARLTDTGLKTSIKMKAIWINITRVVTLFNMIY